MVGVEVVSMEEVASEVVSMAADTVDTMVAMADIAVASEDIEAVTAVADSVVTAIVADSPERGAVSQVGERGPATVPQPMPVWQTASGTVLQDPASQATLAAEPVSAELDSELVGAADTAHGEAAMGMEVGAGVVGDSAGVGAGA